MGWERRNYVSKFSDEDKEPPKYNHTVHAMWLQLIEEESVNLTGWEKEFILSLTIRFRMGKKLSSRKQEVILERIYAERTP